VVGALPVPLEIASAVRFVQCRFQLCAVVASYDTTPDVVLMYHSLLIMDDTIGTENALASTGPRSRHPECGPYLLRLEDLRQSNDRALVIESVGSG
jgi:hypothetical protein